MNLEKGASSRRYGIWSGNPKGYAEDLTRCVVEVGGGSLWGAANAHQCHRPRGHGPNGEYCKQHALKPPRGEGSGEMNDARMVWNWLRYQNAPARVLAAAARLVTTSESDSPPRCLVPQCDGARATR